MTEQAPRLHAVLGGAIVSAIVSLTSMAYGQGWPMGGQNLQNSRSQSVTTISPRNAGTLKQKWVFATKGDIAATPGRFTTVRSTSLGHGGYFYAVDAETGALRWSRRVGHWTASRTTGPGHHGDHRRYVEFLGDTAGARANWTTANGLTGAGARVIAVNRKTGALKWSTQVETFPAAYMTGSPVIYNGNRSYWRILE